MEVISLPSFFLQPAWALNTLLLRGVSWAAGLPFTPGYRSNCFRDHGFDNEQRELVLRFLSGIVGSNCFCFTSAFF
jgi:hypothetical protein